MSDVIVKSEPLTYERNAPHSFFLDVARASTLKDDDAIKRLARHGVETRTNPNGTLGTGGEFSPPGYLIENFATAAKVGRNFAELIGSQPIPRGVSTVNVPRFIGTSILGQNTAIQATQGATVAEFDDTTGYSTSPVASIAGQLVVSQQLFDQAGGPGYDVMAYTELTKDYNAVLNGQLINGSGSSGQLLGLANFSVPGTNTTSGALVPATMTTMIAALWPLMGQVAANVGNNRGHRPEFWLMAPRRWFAIAASLDGQSRPIASPSNVAPEVDSTPGPHAVANIMGIPVYTEGAIPVGAAGATADTIYCGRSGDMYLFESDPMIQTSVTAGSGTLQVKLLMHRYAAFVGNIYTSALGSVTAIPRPTAY